MITWGKYSGLIVSALDSGLCGMVLSPSAGQDYLMCCVPKDSKTLYSHSTTLHQDVWELANLMLGANPVMDLHQIQGG